MDSTAIFLLTAAPYGLLMSSGIVRLISQWLEDKPSSASARQILSIIAYCLIVAAIPCELALLFGIAPIFGVIGLFLSFLIFGTMIEADVRKSRANQKANQAELLWLLATAVKASRPLADEVEAYAAGTRGWRRRRLFVLADGLRDGNTLSEIAVPQGLLPTSVTMQLHAGVETQTLPAALIDAAQRMIRELNDEQSTTPGSTALVIPTVLIPITVLIVGFVMYYIIPKFKRIFDDFGTELPGLTITLIQLSDLFVNYWYLAAAPLFYLCLFGCAVYIITIKSGWQAAYQMTVGRVFMRCHTPDILRALSQSVALGVPITRALAPISRYARPYSLRRRISRVISAIEHGTPGWRALHSAGVLTFYETAALESAERVGNLPWALESIASSLERRLSFRIRVLLEFLGPLLIVAIALVIGMIVIAIFLPLIKLLNDLS